MYFGVLSHWEHVLFGKVCPYGAKHWYHSVTFGCEAMSLFTWWHQFSTFISSSTLAMLPVSHLFTVAECTSVPSRHCLAEVWARARLINAFSPSLSLRRKTIFGVPIDIFKVLCYIVAVIVFLCLFV